MRFLYPKLQVKRLPFILGTALAGAVVAGVYGIVHDQITYLLAPEYFTNLKFYQFAYARNGFSDRVFAGVIGFLATWWVGLVAGWFLARMANPSWRREFAIQRMTIGFGTVLLCGALGGLLGFLLGSLNPDLSAWSGYQDSPFLVVDLPAFVRVAYVHNGGYIGGFVGLIVALIRNHRAKT